MSKEIYNEGRVVGFSAYETYVKQFLAEDPTGDPASEKEWLAASLASGASMILRLSEILANVDGGQLIVDIPLPPTSKLATANTVLASFFDGEVEYSGVEGTIQDISDTTPSIRPLRDTGWATKITSYGQLISGNELSGRLPDPVDDTTSVPKQTIDNWANTGSNRDRLRDYMKIVDGLVIQPGTYKLSEDPKFVPDLAGSDSTPFIRLLIKGPIFGTQILLTGFTVKSVLIGTSKLDGSDAPEDGDFIGPGAYPWANKIVFSVPTSYIAYFASGSYKRQLPADSEALLVQDTPVIDMKSKSGDRSMYPPVLENYYRSTTSSDTKLYPGTSTASQALEAKKSSRVLDSVEDYATLGDGTSVLTVYSKKSIYPPALYGTFVLSTGTNYLHPLDVVSPGSVKVFYKDDGTTMQDYQDTFPGTVAFNKTSDGTLELLNDSGTKVPAADVKVVDFDTQTYDGVNYSYGFAAQIQTGNKTRKAISLSKTGTAGADLSVDGSSGEIAVTMKSGDDSYTHMSWRTLLYALRNNKYFNMLTAIRRNIKNAIAAGKGISVSETSSGVTLSVDLQAGSGITVNNGTGNSKRIRTNLKAGAGIDINPISSDDSTGQQTIAAKLQPGNGISISNVPVENSSSYKKISANLTAGTGISLVPTSTGGYKIVNTHPYDPGKKYINLSDLNDNISGPIFSVYVHNYVRSYKIAANSSTGEYMILQGSTDTPWVYTNMNCPIELSMYCSETYDDLGTKHNEKPVGLPTSVEFRILGVHEDHGARLGISQFATQYHIGSRWEYYNGYAFKHTKDWDTCTGNSSQLFSIQFKNNSYVWVDSGGYYVNIKDLFQTTTSTDEHGRTIYKYKYFSQQDMSDSGQVWNIQEHYVTDPDTNPKHSYCGKARASWSAVISCIRPPAEYKLNITKSEIISNGSIEEADSKLKDKDIVVYAGSYADGYNSQIHATMDGNAIYSTHHSGTLMSHHINLSAGMLLYR